MEFTVIGEFTAFVRRPSSETNPAPWRQRISALVQFTPSWRGMIPSETDLATYVIAPMTARLEDGVIKNIPGLPINTAIPAELPGDPPNHRRYGVRLVANTTALGPLVALEYRVTFDKVVYDRKDQRLTAFSFDAPTEDIVIDLATVPRIKPRQTTNWLTGVS